MSALSPKRKVLRIRVKILENRIWEMAVISACTLHNSATRQANCNHALGQGYGRICKWYGVYHCIKNLRLHYTTRPPSPVLCINFVKNVHTAIFKHFLAVIGGLVSTVDLTLAILFLCTSYLWLFPSQYSNFR